MIDIGAGTGRDAAWFGTRGYHVLAVEPVAAFRNAGTALHQSSPIEWLDDSLPYLRRTLERGETFDAVMVNAVWQHMDDEQRRIALPNMKKLTARNGHLIISVRNGPGVPTRPCFATRAEDTITLARTAGLNLVFSKTTNSVQTENRAAGVTWTWLAFVPVKQDPLMTAAPSGLLI